MHNKSHPVLCFMLPSYHTAEPNILPLAFPEKDPVSTSPTLTNTCQPRWLRDTYPWCWKVPYVFVFMPAELDRGVSYLCPGSAGVVADVTLPRKASDGSLPVVSFRSPFLASRVYEQGPVMLVTP